MPSLLRAASCKQPITVNQRGPEQYSGPQLVEKVLRTFPPSWGKFQNLLHKFRNFVIPTRKKTLTVFFHTIFPSESFGRSGFSTV